ncbi:MAG: hybrid sensor histidine kinase/response regulator [SAR324 cluster bacterium]|nr:hybrid sensor histidine kinase/response regulator [SAR324 cluster bacterium]
MTNNLCKGCILIVDDMPANLEVLLEFLDIEDYEVLVAIDGESAIQRARYALPDIILLDVMMPKLNGFETCQRLKKIPEVKEIPVIFMTALSETVNKVKGFDLGAVDYITKPLHHQEVLARVETHLELKRSKEMIVQKNTEQKELLHVLCHDLMNPIGLVQSFLEIMEEQPDFFSKAKPHIEKAMGNAKSIIDLIRQIQGIEEGKIQLDLTSINLKDAITESLMLLNHKFTKKEIEPIVTVSKELHVQAERTSLVNSVFNNLLTNAVKYSFSRSKVMIGAQSSGNSVVLSIRDFGMGIPTPLLQDIFKIHKPTTRQGTNGELGTGFGMPLVKKFVTAYEASIEISSKDQSEFPDDHGTEVKLFLKIH